MDNLDLLIQTRNRNEFVNNNKKVILLVLLGAALLSVLIAVLLYVYLPRIGDEPNFKNGAVTANGRECAEIGRNILSMNGSAADAAIATLFCEGIACAQCMGLGGGFLATIYKRDTRQAVVLNAREVAPSASYPGMFQGGNISTTRGGMAAAVPGELRGYGELHKRFGRLPWATLVQPAIELCKRGHYVTDYFARVLGNSKAQILNETSIREVFVNPDTGDVWKEGDLIRRPKLAETLEIIAREGPEALHNGSLTQRFIDDIRNDFNAIITVQDMNDYRPEWQVPARFVVSENLEGHTVPLPGGGHVLTFIMNMLRGWVGGPDAARGTAAFWHRIVESFKYGYALRTGLGDLEYVNATEIQPVLHNLTTLTAIPWYRSQISDDRTYGDWRHYGAFFDQPEDHGTAHISVISADGDAVAVTSTINFILGAMRRSRSTDILLNNEMDDFSHPGLPSVYNMPPSPANFPEAGKRPLSSMCPTIITGPSGDVRLVVGAAGGTKITTQVALLIMSHLWYNEPLGEAVDSPRLHHQLMPAYIQHEHDFDERTLMQLRLIGHNTTEQAPTAGFAAITAISVDAEGRIWPRTDKRRPGSQAGY